MHIFWVKVSHFKCVLSKSICCLCNIEGVFKKWGRVYERHGQEDSWEILKYWFDFCSIMTVAIILGPRYKLQFVEWAYKKFYVDDSDELKNIIEELSSFSMIMIL